MNGVERLLIGFAACCFGGNECVGVPLCWRCCVWIVNCLVVGIVGIVGGKLGFLENCGNNAIIAAMALKIEILRDNAMRERRDGVLEVCGEKEPS